MNNIEALFESLELTTEESQMLEEAAQLLGISIEELVKRGTISEANRLIAENLHKQNEMATNVIIDSTLLDQITCQLHKDIN